jgi:general secretion pathway protein J
MSVAIKAPRRASHAEAGFTLVELLVALTLVALLVPMVFGGFRFGVRVWSGAEAVTERGELASVRAVLSDRISMAYPDFLGGDPTSQHVDFTGDHDRLAFLSPTPAAAGGASFSRFTLMLTGTGMAKRLVMNWQPEFGSDDAAKAEGLVHDTDLVDAVAKLELSYYGRVAGDEGPAWHDAWQGQLRLPQLVRIRLGFRDDDDRAWPDLLIRPMVTMDATCAFDPVSRSCRGRPS